MVTRKDVLNLLVGGGKKKSLNCFCKENQCYVLESLGFSHQWEMGLISNLYDL